LTVATGGEQNPAHASQEQAPPWQL